MSKNMHTVGEKQRKNDTELHNNLQSSHIYIVDE